jgi:hypothetical protein
MINVIITTDVLTRRSLDLITFSLVSENIILNCADRSFGSFSHACHSSSCALATLKRSRCITPTSRNLLENFALAQLAKEMPHFLVCNPKFPYRVQKSSHLVLSSAQSASSHAICSASVLMLSSNVILGLSHVVFPSGFLAKIL